jgi:hypothetical protein
MKKTKEIYHAAEFREDSRLTDGDMRLYMELNTLGYYETNIRIPGEEKYYRKLRTVVIADWPEFEHLLKLGYIILTHELDYGYMNTVLLYPVF